MRPAKHILDSFALKAYAHGLAMARDTIAETAGSDMSPVDIQRIKLLSALIKLAREVAEETVY